MRRLLRLIYAIGALIGIAAIACGAYALLDLREWEWRPLIGFTGPLGALFIAFLVSGGLVMSVLLARPALGRPALANRSRFRLTVLLSMWGAAVLWLADWVYMEVPITSRIEAMFVDPVDLERQRQVAIEAAIARARSDGSISAFTMEGAEPDTERLSVMLARIAVNRPAVFKDVSIGRTIRSYAEAYDVNEVLLLHWAYIDSFYGEAPPGPMPMFSGGINPETFRDLVQVHLPAWLIESSFRRWLIEGPLFDSIGSAHIARKLKYAVQKASYDIAISPYMNSVFADTFLVFTEFPEEFPELLRAEGTDDPLANAFLSLKGIGLLQPYDAPYVHAPRTPAYYDEHRNALIDFSRSAVYRLTSDFDFATKVQALVARYYAREYEKRIGVQNWRALTERQRTALLAMLRDVYVPNIGKVSYNLYMLPEFNNTPIAYLSNSLFKDIDRAVASQDVWRPADLDETMWGAGGLMLRVLGETWEVVTGTRLPGVPPAQTVEDAKSVVARNYTPSGWFLTQVPTKEANTP